METFLSEHMSVVLDKDKLKRATDRNVICFDRGATPGCISYKLIFLMKRVYEEAYDINIKYFIVDYGQNDIDEKCIDKFEDGKLDIRKFSPTQNAAKTYKDELLCSFSSTRSNIIVGVGDDEEYYLGMY